MSNPLPRLAQELVRERNKLQCQRGRMKEIASISWVFERGQSFDQSAYSERMRGCYQIATQCLAEIDAQIASIDRVLDAFKGEENRSAETGS